MEKRDPYRILVEEPEGKRLLGRPRRMWVDKFKVNVLEIGWGNVDWIIWLRIGISGELL
jgi:hypothetical protein